MSSSRWVHLEDCTIIKITDKAMLIEYQEEEIWLPLSQISDAEEYEEGDENTTISITQWIADQKGIE